MKRLIFVVLSLLAFNTLTSAQEAKSGDFNVGITAGGGMAWIRNDDNSTFGVEEKKIANIQGGFVFDYTFVDNLFIEGGLSLQRKGKKTEFGVYEAKISMLYLEVPVTLNYHVNLPNFGLIPYAGPFVAYGLGGTAEIKTSNSFPYIMEEEFSEKQDPFDEEGVERFDFGIRLGFSMAFSKRVKLNLGTDLSLLNITRGVDDKEYEGIIEDGTKLSEAKSKNATIFGSLTFYFN